MKKNYCYEIIENSFHGGRHIAYATSLENAILSAKRHDCCSGRGCECGGPEIWNTDGSCLSREQLDEKWFLRWKMRNG